MVSEDLELIRDTERRIWGIVKGSGLFGLVSSLVHLEPLDLRLATISFMVVTILGVFGVIIGKNPYVRFQYNEYLLLFELSQGRRVLKHLLLGFFTVFLLYVLYSLPTENRGLYILFLSPISFIFFYTVTDFVMYGHLSDLKMKTIKNMKKERLQELFQIYRNKEKSKKEVLKVVKDVGKFTSEFDEWIKQIKTEIEEIKKDS